MRRLGMVVLTLAVMILVTACKTESKATRNPEKDLAMRFYTEMMSGDRGAAWDLLHPAQQGTPRDAFVAAWEATPRVKPVVVRVQEWRRPQQQAYTYLIESKDTDPWKIVVTGTETRGYTVLDYGKYKGGELP